MQKIYSTFLEVTQAIVTLFVKKIFTKDVYNVMITASILETFGYFALKGDFKAAILHKIEQDKMSDLKLEVPSLIDCLKYLMLLSVQVNDELDKA